MERNFGARLLAVAEAVPTCKTLVDCGCDHGYVSIYAAEKKRAEYITASDINEGPLANAKKEIEKAGHSGCIKTVLTDGLDGLSRHDCVVIAGMGGETIAEIISRAPWTKNDSTLVLQPMTKAELLREYLYDEGFSITEEKFVSENGHIYCIICAKHTQKNSYEPFEKYISLAGLSDKNAPMYVSLILARLLREYEARKKAGVMDEPEEKKRKDDLESVMKEMDKLCRQ